MKQLGWLLAAVAFGCTSSVEEPPPPPITEAKMPVAPSAPLGVQKPDFTRVQVDLAVVRGEIKKHMQLEGGLPPSIEVLGVKTSYPEDLRYDAKTGVVRSKTYPGL